ncbi:atrial natriuretic peptide receptor 2 [Caerostris darwini]|uniref:Atrial natriuretic peptide receptor 2 n=1 Tax=Caerostris darwini TaxID=1538125 RepID=A0AAV4PK10_9ARAC|nr:atrial natriuretic peptide receptor 2 [Caerostris darwini]
MTWKIKWEEISLSTVNKKMRPGSRISLTRISMTSIVSAETMPLIDMGRQTFSNTGFYKPSKLSRSSIDVHYWVKHAWIEIIDKNN